MGLPALRVLGQADATGLNCERMRKFASFRTIRVSLAFAVSLWMAGAGCLLGCESMAMGSPDAANGASSGDASSPVVSQESCASHQKHSAKAKAADTAPAAIAKKHHSNHHAAQTNKSPANIRETPESSRRAHHNALTSAFARRSSVMECPLAVNATAALSKASADNGKIAPAVTTANRRLPGAPERTNALVRPPHLPNRGHTYLQCCVFLI